MRPQSEWQELFERISIPRLAGSKNCDEVVTRLATLLGDWGYDVQLQHFVAGPERLVGGSVFGALLVPGSIVAAAIVLVDPAEAHVPRAAVFFAVLAFVAVLPAAIAAFVSSGGLYAKWVVRVLGYRFPVGPGSPDGYWVRAANITAVRQPDPRIWLVAHSDSKVQRNSLRTRMAVVWLTGLGAVLLLLGGALRALDYAGRWTTIVTIPGAALVVLGGTVLAAAGLRDGSPGAVDNASGVVAVLAAAEALESRGDVGILITGAEELAMAGARHWVRQGRGGEVFVNFDGVDGKGQYVLWVHKGTAPGVAQSFASQLCDTLGRKDAKVAKYLTFGMFVDGMIFSGTGMAGVTVQRGTVLDTAAVAHTPEDVASRVDIDGAVRAGRAAASVVEAFINQPRHTARGRR